MTSTACWFAMLAFLIYASAIFGPLMLLKIYWVPYMVSRVNLETELLYIIIMSSN